MHSLVSPGLENSSYVKNFCNKTKDIYCMVDPMQLIKLSVDVNKGRKLFPYVIF